MSVSTKRYHEIEKLCQRIQKSNSLSKVFAINALLYQWEENPFLFDTALSRLAMTSLLMQTQDSTPHFVKREALIAINHLYLHRHIENDFALKKTIIQTLGHISYRDKTPQSRAYSIETLGQIINRIPYEKNKALTQKAAFFLIKAAKNLNENWKIRRQAAYLLDQSIDNFAFDSNIKIEKIAQHFPPTRQCPKTDEILSMLPYRIRSIHFKKVMGTPPKNKNVFIPYLH